MAAITETRPESIHGESLMRRSYTWNLALAAAGFAILVGAMFLVFMWVPSAEYVQGPLKGQANIVQRIFYFHVPLWWVAFLGFTLTFVGSVVYLARGSTKWDNRAYCAAEIGILFTTVGLITGVIWAKPEWGVWWTWDPRLTTALVLWFIYIGYFLVRSYAPQSLARNFSAVISIVGTIDSFIVFMAIRWWRTQHPEPLIGTPAGLAPSMLLTFMVSLAAFTILFVVLFRLRTGLRAQQDELIRLQQSQE